MLEFCWFVVGIVEKEGMKLFIVVGCVVMVEYVFCFVLDGECLMLCVLILVDIICEVDYLVDCLGCEVVEDEDIKWVIDV